MYSITITCEQIGDEVCNTTAYVNKTFATEQERSTGDLIAQTLVKVLDATKMSGELQRRQKIQWKEEQKKLEFPSKEDSTEVIQSLNSEFKLYGY